MDADSFYEEFKEALLYTVTDLFPKFCEALALVFLLLIVSGAEPGSV